jgi:glutathione peroxidase
VGLALIHRRTILASILAALTTPARTRTTHAQAAMTRVSVYAFSFPALAGDEIRLANYAGRPLLVVNTASLCGFTPQYAGLQQLWTEFHDRGLMIVGVPLQRFRLPRAGWRHRNRRSRSTNMV